MNRKGMPATPQRHDDVDQVVAALLRRAQLDGRVAAVGMCGSWAAGRPTMASDVDIVVVTDDRGALVGDRSWRQEVLGADSELTRQQDWGPMLTELRYLTPSGLEVELGVVDTSWASADPVDPGTERIVRDGFTVLHDPGGLLARLEAAVRTPSGTPGEEGGRAVQLAAVEDVEVIVAHQARATLRVGDVFLKVDPQQENIEAEVEAMALAPVPTPEVLWHQPPVLALSRVPGTALGRLGEPSPHPASAWVAAGAAIRALHDAPLPPRVGPSLDLRAAKLADECDWLISNDVLPVDLVNHNRQICTAAFQPRNPVFAHGDLQVCHVFVEGGEVTGIIDWSEAAQGDPMFDLAVLTYGHPEHLDDIAAGYGTGFDLDAIRGWWSFRCLTAIRWLVEHGYGPAEDMPEVAVLRSQR